MIIYKKTLLFILFILFSLNIFGQNDSINPNGFNIFYYPNGFKLSEGSLKSGKPDGYWVTYFVNGNKKSEGNRKNYMLDSLWIFYAENGDTSETIYYLENKKNGYYTKYYTKYDSSKNNIIKSKELFLDDKKQGFSFYYYSNGQLKEKIKYKDNYKNGQGFEYSKEGILIAIDEYRYNNLISRQAVNRKNREGIKSGKWVEVYENGKLKSEINFEKGMPNGSYKEFSPSGKIIKLEKYEKGKIISQTNNPKYDTLEVKNLRQEKNYYENGILKSIKTYKDSILFGLQLFYDKNGEIEKAELYDELGIKTAEGTIDTLSKRQNNWFFYYEDGTKHAEGRYVDNKRQGEWVYYYSNGNIFEKGEFENDYPEGVWTWFYSDGKVLRVENYFLGDKSGITYELNIQGDTIVKGKYSENSKHGKWFYKIGDEYTTGNYYFGQKTGTWEIYYFPEMKIKCRTEYVNGKELGKHKCYYINKKLKEIGQYSNGKKSGKWTYYTEDGKIDFTAEYIGGEINKVNDLLIK